MKKFGYIINPKETRLYKLSGSFSKIRLNLPIVKDEVMKISEIYDQGNRYMGDILSSPARVDPEQAKEKLLSYMTKAHLDFICLGDGVRNKNLVGVEHNKLITGVHGMAYISVLFIKKYLKELLEMSIYEAEIVIAVDGYSSFAKEFIKYLSSQCNYVLLTGKGLERDEDLLDQIFDSHGISLGFNGDYTSLGSNWHVFINLSTNVQLNKLKKKDEEGIIIDPLFLIQGKSDRYKCISNLSLYCEEIVFFNKLNIINNAYPAQFIESLVRSKNPNSLDGIYDLLEEEIIENRYELRDE